MTNGERIARWRKRHANKLARKAARRPTQNHLPLTMCQAVFLIIIGREDGCNFFIRF